MSSLEEIRAARLKKLRLLEDAFGSAYPARTNRTHLVADITAKFSQLLRGKKKITIAGRVRSLRPHGGSTFFDLEEQNIRIQGFLRKEDIDEKLYTLFQDGIDIGDFVEITGHPYLTKRKEKSILITSWKPLVKSLRPLPEKWHGLQNVEERYRTRALDLLSNPDVKNIFTARSKTITFLRSHLDKLGFLEVETPVLQPIPGGATARPFVTHHNALDIDFYLRIAPELYLKRLLVGGYEKVYEIARNFRNEGIDVTHNPEFTMLEAYIAFEDYEGLMKFIEDMIEKLVRTIIGKKELSYQGKPIAVKKPFKRVTFFELLKRYALLPHIEKMSKGELEIAAKRFGIDVPASSNTAMIMEDIFRKAVRPYLQQPTFIYDWPASLLPLAKRSEKNKDLVESFQLYMGGVELVKAFSELNDPEDQRKRFMEQEERHKKGDEEASPSDYDFLENLEYGMPPAAGFGIGVDRLTLLLTDTHNIRDVILFPTLRPR